MFRLGTGIWVTGFITGLLWLGGCFAQTEDTTKAPLDTKNEIRNKEPGMDTRLQQYLDELEAGGGDFLSLAEAYGFKVDTGLLLELKLDEDADAAQSALASTGAEVTFFSAKYRSATVRIKHLDTLARLKAVNSVRRIAPVYGGIRR